jgi:hypothetical protein
VTMISGNITVPRHPQPMGGGMGKLGWGIVIFQEIIVTTILILKSVHELFFTCLFGSFTKSCNFALSGPRSQNALRAVTSGDLLGCHLGKPMLAILAAVTGPGLRKDES